MNKLFNIEKSLSNKNIVSVIVPVFNDETRIARCIESVISQSFGDFELIIIDDGSQDLSAVIANAYTLKDKRVKIITSLNYGPSSARNLGIKKSIGDFIFFLDSDDYLETDSLKFLVSRIKNHDVDLVIGDFVSVTDKKIQSLNSLYFSKTVNLNKIETNKYISFYLKRPNKYPLFAYSWGRIFKSSIIKKNNLFFNEELRTFEDVDFNFRYLMWTNEICFFNKNILNHTINDSYSSESMRIPDNPSQFLGFKQSLKSVGAYLEEMKINPNIKQEIAHAYVSYTIIQIIRLGLKHTNKNDLTIRNLLSSCVNDKILQDSLFYYSPSRGDSKIIPILIRFKFIWLLLYVCKIKGKARYKS